MYINVEQWYAYHLGSFIIPLYVKLDQVAITDNRKIYILMYEIYTVESR